VLSFQFVISSDADLCVRLLINGMLAAPFGAVTFV
jgi:hypothetical protein